MEDSSSVRAEPSFGPELSVNGNASATNGRTYVPVQDNPNRAAVGLALETYRRWAVKHAWLNEETPEVVTFKDLYSNTEAECAKRLCMCQLCGCKVGVTRFAMHLETCSRRGQRRQRPSQKMKEQQETSNKNATAQERKTTVQKTTTQRSTIKKGNARARVKETPVETEQTSTKRRRLVSEVDEDFDDYFPRNDVMRCLRCKMQTLDDTSMLMCDGCDRCFHEECLQMDESSKLLSESSETWFCSECQKKVLKVAPGEEVIPWSGLGALNKMERGRNCAALSELEYFCNGCGKLLPLVRIRCLVCPNFDCCEACLRLFSRKENSGESTVSEESVAAEGSSSKSSEGQAPQVKEEGEVDIYTTPYFTTHSSKHGITWFSV